MSKSLQSNKEQEKALIEKRTALIQSLRSAIESGDTEAIKGIKEQLDIVEFLLKESHRKKNGIQAILNSGWGYFLLFILLGALIFVFSKRPHENISLELSTTLLNFKLEEDWLLEEPLQMRGAYIEGIENMQIGKNMIRESAEEYFDIDIKGNLVKLSELKIHKGAEMALEVQQDNLKCLLKNDSMSLKISAWDYQVSSTNPKIESIAADSVNPEIFKIQTRKSVGLPIEMELLKISRLTIRDMRINVIDFMREFHSPGSGRFRSAILEGKVRMLDTGQEFEIRHRDVLALELRKPFRFEIYSFTDSLKLFLDAEVSNIELGPQGLLRNLKSTHIDYWYYNGKMGFYYGVFVSLFALVFSFTRKVISLLTGGTF